MPIPDDSDDADVHFLWQALAERLEEHESAKRHRRSSCAGLRHRPMPTGQPWAASACNRNPRAPITLRMVLKSGLRSPDSAL